MAVELAKSGNSRRPSHRFSFARRGGNRVTRDPFLKNREKVEAGHRAFSTTELQQRDRFRAGLLFAPEAAFATRDKAAD